MTKLDDLAARAAGQLRAAVDDHLEANPVAPPRKPAVPRSAVALGVVVLLVAGALSWNAQRPDTRLQIGDNSGRTDSDVDSPQSDDVHDEESGTPIGGAVVGDAEPRSGDAPTRRGGGKSSSQTTLPGSSPPPAGAATEPPSTESGPYTTTCDMTITPMDPTGENRPEFCVTGHGGDPSTTGGKGHPLRVTTCRDLPKGDGVLHFPRRQEADFLVTDSRGKEVWRWSKTRPSVAQPHARMVGGGYCIEWMVYWPEQDQAGRPVPKGRYRLLVTVLADEMNGKWWAVQQELLVGGLGG